ncbi:MULTISPECIES: YesL family protein [Caproicibacterium]|uniref:DUF624 domain-containing protein n=1 Tax=Caproicibacterium lactatifermentans TaxID=2666138 RepID=A0A859DQ75_9FIRM|nr:YesL family protein [Caproicibacterium lactatifermentans]QKN23960.1 DUF624 domain-containing protein [Caproicibacterium lactatifermentans]QKO30968.1 DUF624 domain-containing protein [Caproicibacterium lactatifermentans]
MYDKHKRKIILLKGSHIMGLFSNYNRPGPGISKNEPKPNRFVHYWQIFGRHFWDFIKLNLLFAVPAILLLVAFVVIDAKTKSILLAGLPLIALSPFLAGLTYETRNYIREEHVFILHDFFQKLKENWKQFLSNGIICYLVYGTLSIAIPFYASAQNQKQLGMPIIIAAFAISFAILFIFTSMQFYIPLQIVTFNMKLSQMYKNAGIFAISALGWNLIAFAISAVLAFFLLSFMWIGQYIALFLLIIFAVALFFLWSFWSYTVNSLVYPIIDRHMLQPALKEKEASEGNESSMMEEEGIPDFTDWDTIHKKDTNDDDDDEED